MKSMTIVKLIVVLINNSNGKYKDCVNLAVVIGVSNYSKNLGNVAEIFEK